MSDKLVTIKVEIEVPSDKSLNPDDLKLKFQDAVWADYELTCEVSDTEMVATWVDGDMVYV